MKLRYLLCFSVCFAFAFLDFLNPAYALPGDSMRGSMRFINNNLGFSVDFRESSIGGSFLGYQAELTYRNEVHVNLGINNPSYHELNDHLELITFTSNGIVSLQSGERYNPRQHSELLDIIRNIWGNRVAQDFINSRFTNKYNSPGNFYRGTYQGEQFGYEVLYSREDLAQPRRFSIYSLEDFWYPSAQGVYED